VRIDPDTCRDADLLAAEVRRLRAVIAASEPTLTDEEREAVAECYEWAAVADHRSLAATLRGLLERLK
jgi:hypothetical protein